MPALWDKKTNQMVNNESLEMLQNFNDGFNSILPDEYKELSIYPENLREQIDEIGKWMQADLNTGVYKAGFAPFPGDVYRIPYAYCYRCSEAIDQPQQNTHHDKNFQELN